MGWCPYHCVLSLSQFPHEFENKDDVKKGKKKIVWPDDKEGMLEPGPYRIVYRKDGASCGFIVHTEQKPGSGRGTGDLVLCT